MQYTAAPRHSRRQALALTLAPALGLAPLWGTTPAWAAAEGQPAPPLSLPGTAGVVDLAAYKGKVVYLDFWASWCGPCKLSFPWLNDMQARHGARGLQVVAVNLDRQRALADAFLAQVPARFVLAFDPAGDSARRYAVQGMPSSVLIGADGLVLQQHSGFRDEDRAGREAAIVAALARVTRP
ncbi:MAG: TlpA family protein disulfide reductase [Rubrivivax sp.]|nr:TlpA family protein disulfide reductase [Rubrivivax sp.]